MKIKIMENKPVAKAVLVGGLALLLDRLIGSLENVGGDVAVVVSFITAFLIAYYVLDN